MRVTKKTLCLFASWMVGLLIPAVALTRNTAVAQDAQPQAPSLASQQFRCAVIPLADERFSIRVDGRERLVWNFDDDAPRPCFYPVIGPSGQSVTRMGHPGAPNHDHHRSLWFAHHKVDGTDFWSNGTGAQIRQKQWLAIEDGEREARLAVLLGWYAEDGRELISQELICRVEPTGDGQTQVELQSTFRPAGSLGEVTLEQTNFGLLAIRLSKTISAVFGVGRLTADSGASGEEQIFGKSHRWVDYSGATPIQGPEGSEWFEEGVTYFDHPSNPGYPNGWHVREDGWMCASPSMQGDIKITQERPLRLRYLLDIHANHYEAQRAQQAFDGFAQSPPMRVEKSSKPHTAFVILQEAP